VVFPRAFERRRSAERRHPDDAEPATGKAEAATLKDSPAKPQDLFERAQVCPAAPLASPEY
jgi:hypothetical protein